MYSSDNVSNNLFNLSFRKAFSKIFYYRIKGRNFRLNCFELVLAFDDMFLHLLNSVLR